MEQQPTQASQPNIDPLAISAAEQSAAQATPFRHVGELAVGGAVAYLGTRNIDPSAVRTFGEHTTQQGQEATAALLVGAREIGRRVVDATVWVKQGASRHISRGSLKLWSKTFDPAERANQWIDRQKDATTDAIVDAPITARLATAKAWRNHKENKVDRLEAADEKIRDLQDAREHVISVFQPGPNAKPIKRAPNTTITLRETLTLKRKSGQRQRDHDRHSRMLKLERNYGKPVFEPITYTKNDAAGIAIPGSERPGWVDKEGVVQRTFITSRHAAVADKYVGTTIVGSDMGTARHEARLAGKRHTPKGRRTEVKAIKEHGRFGTAREAWDERMEQQADGNDLIGQVREKHLKNIEDRHDRATERVAELDLNIAGKTRARTNKRRARAAARTARRATPHP